MRFLTHLFVALGDQRPLQSAQARRLFNQFEIAGRARFADV
jgi:hypothetical protein